MKMLIYVLILIGVPSAIHGLSYIIALLSGGDEYLIRIIVATSFAGACSLLSIPMLKRYFAEKKAALNESAKSKSVSIKKRSVFNDSYDIDSEDDFVAIHIVSEGIKKRNAK